MRECKLEHICSYYATLAEPEILGPAPEGIRVNFYVTGGEVTGPRLRGKIRPVGGDWLTVRRDGVAVLDVRATIESHDGALIYIHYNGVIDLGEKGFEDFQRGAMAPAVQIRAAPRFATAHPDYLWLNRLQCVSVGEGRPGEGIVEYDVFSVG